MEAILETQVTVFNQRMERTLLSKAIRSNNNYFVTRYHIGINKDCTNLKKIYEQLHYWHVNLTHIQI